ncbi:MAG: hypothetical protein RR051_04220, partial [Clostridiales bacterium]
MAINFNSIQNALDKQEEKKKQKGTANQPSPTVSYTKAQKMASNRLHSDDVKLSYSVADTARNRKSTRPTPAQKKREEEKK